MVDTPPKNKRALLLIETSACLSHARSILGKYKIAITTEYDSLNSITVIKKSFIDTRNTVFIRKSFMRMVNDWGPPFLIILDYRINLGPDSIHDADHRKLLRTFFISLIIMMKKGVLEGARVNFILLTDKADFAEALNFQKNPVTILDILKSDNEEVNNLITGIRNDPAEFNSIFRIIALPGSAFEASFEKAVMALTQREEPKKAELIQEVRAERPSTVSAEKKEPVTAPVAHIAFRVDASTAYLDGVQVRVEDNASLRSMTGGQFYVCGRWEYKNQAEVARLLGEYVTNGIGGRRFHKDDEIVINLSDHCTIDATVIASLVMLFTKQLSVFNNKSIVVSYDNAAILENGSGYIIIKKYIRHAY